MKNKIVKLTALCLAILLASFGLSACGSDSAANGNGQSGSESSQQEDISMSSEDVPVSDDTYEAATMESFQSEAASWGEVSDVTDQLTYEASVMKSEKLTMIYMKTNNVEQAENILIDNTSDEESHVKVLRQGGNYTYYEEEQKDGDEPFYGYYLRIENVLLLVTGAPEDRQQIKSAAGELFQKMGYAAS